MGAGHFAQFSPDAKKLVPPMANPHATHATQTTD